MSQSYRKSKQHLCPVEHPEIEKGYYDIYPAFPLPQGKVYIGFDSLADVLAGKNTVIIDGYGGVFWHDFRERLDLALSRLNLRTKWHNVDNALRPQTEIDTLIEPYLGGEDALFGSRYPGSLADFFDKQALLAIEPSSQADVNILYGCGAALAGWQGYLVYIDLPKNEIQFRSRAGSIDNLGFDQPMPPKKMYKQFYFIDWTILNRHKAGLLSEIDLLVDGQRPENPSWMYGEDFIAALDVMSINFFRVRPWFEPGPWGGQWIREHIHQLPENEPNYAWSFELISPENGLLFEEAGNMLEVSFDWLMYRASKNVLGKHEKRFGYEFPIRYDFLDTYDGGNLSIQCHPHPDYIQEHFGEKYTQDEAYYILDAKPGAQVYLGFQQDIDPDVFRGELERSQQHQVEIDIDSFVNHLPSARHDLFLIPHGTIHGSGVNNLVLEISATPYIFTFKMYDWMRLDLDGQPRPLNIDRAFENLDFNRKGERVKKELISRPYMLEKGEDWQIFHLPTHSLHFYDVHRMEFTSTLQVSLSGSPHVLNLVEGEWVILETPSGLRHRFNYAETFIVPAAAGSYRLVNETRRALKVVKTFLKDDGV